MKTRERILEKALEMMNQAGSDAVSTYEMAKALNIRQSNITYYFPTKTQLVNALFKQMVAEVNQTIEAIDPARFSFRTYYASLDKVLQVHQRYRFLLMNYATLITADPELNQYLKEVLQTRLPEFKGMVSLLGANGFLHAEGLLAQSEAVILMLNIVMVYWVQEAAIYSADKTEAQKRHHHMWLFFQIFIPYLTEQGRKDLLPLFEKA